MPVGKQEILIHLWRLLKQPFTLPPDTRHTHTCMWKAIDAGLLGCTLCGNIHACNALQCRDVIENDDGTVCALSGVYIRDKQYSKTEYQDTVNWTDGKLSHRVVEETMYSDIKSIFHSLLLSDVARALYYKQRIMLTTRWHQQYKRMSNNVLLWCTSLLLETQKNTSTFDTSQRRQMVALASKQCFNVLMTLITQFGMLVKANEIQHIAVGLLYLMRAGIQVRNTKILPLIPGLRHMLPPENMLNDHFSIRSKFITESENRAKYCLRNCKHQHLNSFDFLLPQLKI